MKLLKPHEAKWYYRALCVETEAVTGEYRVFEFYLETNDTTEAREEIAESGWTIIQGACLSIGES